MILAAREDGPDLFGIALMTSELEMLKDVLVRNEKIRRGSRAGFGSGSVARRGARLGSGLHHIE